MNQHHEEGGGADCLYVTGVTGGFEYSYSLGLGRDVWLWAVRGPGLERCGEAASEPDARQAIQRELCLAAVAAD
jgi:hypothetical protein